MRTLMLFFLVIFCYCSNAQQTSNTHSIIPAPNYFQASGDSIMLPSTLRLDLDSSIQPDEKRSIQLLTSALQRPIVQKKSGLTIRCITQNLSFCSVDSYEISIQPDTIILKGQHQGLFYAVQTLIQLLNPSSSTLKPIKLPCVQIKDQARYHYRGLHLDVSRHFFSVATIKTLLQQMAFYKLNRFHWHLTDDQGWRIEIKKFPKLTSIGAKRAQTLVGNKFERFPYFYDSTPYGGYYTQDEIKEVVRYATEKYITVIPEIEMPGHASAALSAYPNLACFPEKNYTVKEHWGIFEDVFCAGKEETFVFLENVLSEVFELFPSTFIHVGGDECPKSRWKVCPSCQQKITELGLKNENELQSYFLKRIEKFLNRNGRQMLGWDEVVEGGLAPNAAVMSWRGESGGIQAARQKHLVVMTPEDKLYLDHNQGFSPDEPLSVGRLTTLKEVYHYNPTPIDSLDLEEQSYIYGVQANLWSEYIDNSKKLQYMLFPRLFALAEIAWTNPEQKNYRQFMLNRLAHHLELLDSQNIFYKVPAPFGIADTAMIASNFRLEMQPTILNGKIYYTLDGSSPDETSQIYTTPTSFTIPNGEFRIFQIVQINAKGRRSSITKIIVRNTEMRTASTQLPNRNGLRFFYFSEKKPFEHTTELAQFSVKRLGIDTLCISHQSFKSKTIPYMGLCWEGFIAIPTTGNYTFSVVSDDGSSLSIDDEKIVDNDGKHWVHEAFGAVRLEKGFHKIKIHYFDAGGSAFLKCFMQSDKQEKKEINPSQLFYLE